MKLRHHLVILLTIASLALLGLGTTALFQFNRNDTLMQRLTDSAIPGFIGASQLASELKSTQLATLNLVASPSNDIAEQYQQKLGASRAEIQQLLKSQSDFAAGDKQQGIITQARESLTQYNNALDDVVKMRMAGQREVAEALLAGTAEPYLRELEQILETLRVETSRTKDESFAETEAARADTTRILMATTASTLILLTLLGINLYRKITSPLRTMEKTMAAIASSLDFTQRVPVDRDDEIGQSIQAFNRLLDTLQGSLSEMANVISRNEIAAIELHQSAVTLSYVASQGDLSSKDVQQSVREIQSQIDRIKQDTQQAGDLTAQSGQQATENGTVIRQTVSRINQLASSVETAADRVYALAAAGNNIAGQIREIREIADQTNLLALNAAIEAARAGESGRGFAVVADEVRKLAERVTAATLSISQQVKDIAQTSEDSTRLMRDVVDDMNSHIAYASTAGDAMSGIENSARQVIAVVEQIDRQVGVGHASSRDIVVRMDTIDELMVKANVAANETKDFADTIRSFSGEMAEIVNRFRIGQQSLTPVTDTGSVTLY